MIRCKYIIAAYKENHILQNVNSMSDLLFSGLRKMNNIMNIRKCGLVFAFDFISKENRDKFMSFLIEHGFICNPTRDITIRLRPNLNVNEDEISHAINILNDADNIL